MQTDLSLPLSIVHKPSKVTGWWVSCQKTGLFMMSSERAASIPSLAAEDRASHRFTCQLPGERDREREREGERLLSSIALPIPPSLCTCQSIEARVAVETWLCAGEVMCMSSRVSVSQSETLAGQMGSDMTWHDRTAPTTAAWQCWRHERNSAFQGML